MQPPRAAYAAPAAARGITQNMLLAPLTLALVPQPGLVAGPSRPLVAAPPPACRRVAQVRLDAAPGNGIVDAFYSLMVAGILAFAVRNVFDSVFIENDGFKPPVPTKLLDNVNPFGGGADPIVEAERIRGELQAAIEAQDMARAFQLNKELKQYMMEAGLKYELDDDEEEALPIADDISPFVDSGDP